ncbi:ParB-like nuclease domain-containing protein [Desulfocicer vacuolatum DSM 3385]|uniref:ParB-like nuclease domain-containing protein n=1 Tax=Desulfocicer vacuolatum DSM 3385 TaxID=1121400 RepID=A0A1W2AL16_9BACT|nr:Lrp/AsnC ligand binding domain-containing protein [Desulfocicer vacuolatum]SMC61141.1 ParB-like nuclease domain-containing protein [Desulfocicer vacuolatum DSM 3385]
MVTTSSTSTLKRWFRKLTGQKDSDTRLKDANYFKTRQEIEGAFDTKDRGVQTVKVAQITGSVGRYQDFDDQFRFRGNKTSERFLSVLEAMRTGKVLPPIKLYQIKDEYYVMDGNHRVAAAKQLKHDEILATILEFIPSIETLDNLLYKEMVQFCEETGLPRVIKLTEPGKYRQLSGQIQQHHQYLKGETKGDVTLFKAARDWYKTIYTPFCAIIKRGGLLERFSNRTLADLYTYISSGYWGKKKNVAYGIGLGRMIPNNMEDFRSNMAKLKELEYPEMKQGITAFVLMNVKGKQENRILERLYELDEVMEVHAVHGDVDLLVKTVLTRDLLSSDAEVISNFVHDKIRQFNGVISTKTLIPGVSKIKPQEVLF